jgi:hypothetical protein
VTSPSAIRYGSLVLVLIQEQQLVGRYYLDEDGDGDDLVSSEG